MVGWLLLNANHLPALNAQWASTFVNEQFEHETMQFNNITHSTFYSQFSSLILVWLFEMKIGHVITFARSCISVLESHSLLLRVRMHIFVSESLINNVIDTSTYYTSTSFNGSWSNKLNKWWFSYSKIKN